MKRKAGIFALILMGILIFIDSLIPKNRDVPASLRGCYYSKYAPNITLKSDRIIIFQNETIEVPIKYSRGGSFRSLEIEQPWELEHYFYDQYIFKLKESVRYIIRISEDPAPSLIFMSPHGVSMKYTRAKCPDE